MRWYAETPALRRRQLVGDALVLVRSAVWLRVGVALHDAVQRLAVPGRELREAGTGLRSGLQDAAGRADRASGRRSCGRATARPPGAAP